jgi:hypothetical protein
MRDFNPAFWVRFRNYNKIAESIGYNIMKLFFDKLMDKLMTSNRIILDNKLGSNQKREMYITDVQQSHKNFLNSHTNGKVYNAVITGFNPPISLKLSLKRKQELKTRLESGQSFY